MADEHGTPDEKKRLKELRERLYARDGKNREFRSRHKLTDTSRAVPTSWQHPPGERGKRGDVKRPAGPSAGEAPQMPRETHQPKAAQVPPSETPPIMARMRGVRRYRMKTLLAGTVFFVLAVGASALFFFYGNNTISGANISIEVNGPFAVGGGQELPLQIAVSNQNAVPIESATLIIEYPPGTQSASDEGREVFTERIPLNVINAGEVVNVPARAVVFGEENAERTVNVSIEYRVRNSNATFFKEAKPFTFKISSSPVILVVDAVERISSGQEAVIELTVASNAPTPLSGILVKAEYPFGFDFSSAEPDTSSGQDTWYIDRLAPEERKTITVRGIVVGNQDEERVFRFSAGVPTENDRFSLGSIFTAVEHEIDIEQPFLNVGVAVNSKTSDTVVVSSREHANVQVTFNNTLDATVYDGIVEAKLSGNALDEINVRTQNGHYDSTTNTLTWDSVDVSSLAEIPPGRSSIVSFTLEPEEEIDRTPEITLSITVRANRIFEDRVPQELTGTASRVVRIESVTELTSRALYSTGPFKNTGPIPPIAEEVTQYTFMLDVQNGSNDITDAEVTATLPPYVTWLDLTTAGDTVAFDSVNRTLTWQIGDMDANETESVGMQVSFLPSFSQVGSIPTLLGPQRLRATDRFTGTVLRDEAPALSTAVSADPEFEAGDAQVQEPD